MQYGKKINSLSEIIKEEDENKKNILKGIGNNKTTNKSSKIENGGRKIINYKMSFNNILKNNSNNKFQKIPFKTPDRNRKFENRTVSTDKIKYHKYMNLNNIGNDNSEYINLLKKAISYHIGLQNRTEDESKFRSGLLSAGRSNNNNIIIPIISNKRPNSNFIFSGEQSLNNLMNGVRKVKTSDIINKNYEQSPSEINDTNLNKFSQINKMKNNQKYNLYNKSRNNKTANLSKKNNRFAGIGVFDRDKIFNKFHKIKIEKGMMNSGLISSINQKLLGEYNSRIKQFKNSYLPMVVVEPGMKLNNLNKPLKLEQPNINRYISKSLNKDN